MSDYDFPADVPTKPFHEEVTAIFAGRSSGKTTLAKKLIIDHKPRQLVWIDPTQPAQTSLADLQAKIRAGEKSIMFGGGDPKLALAALMYCYAESTKEKPIYVVCDEARKYLDKKRDDIASIFNLGRHAGLGVMIISQRPSAVHPDYRNQASIFHWGRLVQADAQIASGTIGSEAAANLPSAKVGEFIEAKP